MTQPILKTIELSKNYRVGGHFLAVLEKISVKIKPGTFVVIAGSSGSGKTTLLSLLSGIDRPSSGEIWIDGTDITDFKENDLAPIRNKVIGFVFQAFHLVPSLNALENVMFPAELQKDPESRRKASQLLKRVGLWGRHLNMVEQLSGGEKQRVAICRALINKPKLIFADEPTGNLDSENSRQVMGLLMELYKENKATLVMATHSSEISKMADRVLHLHDGCLVQDEIRT